MTRCLFAVLISSSIVLYSCSKSVNPETPTRIASGFHTESSADIREEKNSWTYVTSNSSFQFADVLGDKGIYEAVLLLEENYRNENTPGIEGMRGDATVKAWTIDTARRRALRWTIGGKANAGEIRERFFRLTAWGCCDSPNVYTYYNLLSGKKLYVTNSDLLEIRGMGEGPLAARFVGFGYDMNNPGQDPVLQYGTDKDVAQRFALHSGKNYYDTPEVLGAARNQLEKYHLDLSDSPLTFFIVVRYPGEAEIRIPVENDAIRPEKATLPKGYSIRKENLAEAELLPKSP
jgi:hypothetical protein